MRVLGGEVIPSAAPAELVVTSATGREVIQHITGAPFHDATGQVVGAVMVSRDVTEQRRLEQQRTDILRVVAHDLANPLAAVKMYVQTQERSVRRGQPPRVPDPAFLATMSQAIERMQRLLGDMRVVVGLEANELSLDLGPCDLVALCQQEVQTTRVATERDVRINLPDGPVVASADRDRIGQVLANLLSNADKYSPTERPITLSLRVEPTQRHTEPRAGTQVAQWARVLIQDEGPGIPLEEQAHIWERFHRVTGVQARPGAGGSLGLGLYISREIIERHGGTIGVESAPGAGSGFWFTLPLASPAG
jgi:signal transduction histidine kinase